MKPDQTSGDGKGVKQSEMFNYSVYSRLGNKVNYIENILSTYFKDRTTVLQTIHKSSVHAVFVHNTTPPLLWILGHSVVNIVDTNKTSNFKSQCSKRIVAKI